MKQLRHLTKFMSCIVCLFLLTSCSHTSSLNNDINLNSDSNSGAGGKLNEENELDEEDNLNSEEFKLANVSPKPYYSISFKSTSDMADLPWRD